MHRIAVVALFAVFFLCGCDKERDTYEERHEEVKPVSHEQSKNQNPESKIAASGNLARIQDAKVIRIGIKSDAPPFCFLDKDGNPQGFDVDIGARLARH